MTRTIKVNKLRPTAVTRINLPKTLEESSAEKFEIVNYSSLTSGKRSQLNEVRELLEQAR